MHDRLRELKIKRCRNKDLEMQPDLIFKCPLGGREEKTDTKGDVFDVSDD